MKRRILLYIATVLSLCSLAVPILVHAATTDPFETVCDSTTINSSVCIDKNNPTNPVSGNNSLIIKGARILSLLTGAASVLMIVFGSIKYITASTHDKGESVASAKNTIVYAIVGLVVSLAAQGLIAFVVSRLN